VDRVASIGETQGLVGGGAGGPGLDGSRGEEEYIHARSRGGVQ